MATKAPIDYTNPQKIVRQMEMIGQGAMRKEYTRYRDIFVKRYKRAQQAGVNLENVQLPEKLANLKKKGKLNVKEFAKEMAVMAKWINNPHSTSGGRKEIKKRTVQALEDITGITKEREEHEKKRKEIKAKSGKDIGKFESPIEEESLDRLSDFMQWWRQKYEYHTPQGKVQVFDSDGAVSAFYDLARQGKITDKSNASSFSRMFNKWMESQGYDRDAIEETRKETRKQRRKKK